MNRRDGVEHLNDPALLNCLWGKQLSAFQDNKKEAFSDDDDDDD